MNETNPNRRAVLLGLTGAIAATAVVSTIANRRSSAKSPAPVDPFGTMFDAIDDFALCDALACGIEKRYGYETLMRWHADIPIEHRVPHYIWSVSGYTECEGFERFFNLECHHDAYPDALDLIGMNDLAASLRACLATVPRHLLGDTDALIKHFGTWKKFEAHVDGTETVLFKASKPIQAAVAAYVRPRKESYRELYPQLVGQNNWGLEPKVKCF